MVFVKCDKCGRVASAGKMTCWEGTEGNTFCAKDRRGPVDRIDLCYDCCAKFYQFINAGARKMTFEEPAEAENDDWIPVEERLPEDNVSVLMCSTTGYRGVGWWTGKRWVTGFSHADTRKDIVAWQPLPEPYRPGTAAGEDGAEE